jgi:HSP20 family protein
MLESIFPAVSRQKKEVSPRERETGWSLLDEIFAPMSEFQRLSPAVDVTEDEESIKVRVEVPGMDPKDISLTLERNYLLIRGERKKEEEKKEEQAIRRECSYGSFLRTIPLNSPVKEDEIKAKYEKGILEIVLPKVEGTKPKRIEIA